MWVAAVVLVVVVALLALAWLGSGQGGGKQSVIVDDAMVMTNTFQTSRQMRQAVLEKRMQLALEKKRQAYLAKREKTE